MAFRYLALTDADQRSEDGIERVRALLSNLGLRERGTAGPVKLFATQETPVISMPNTGLIIGHLFRREDGSPVLEAPQQSSPILARGHILQRCWGDYILIQPSELDARGYTIMRDPSGGLPCVYVLQELVGFATSDISLAIAAGLYNKRIDWDFVSSCLIYPHQRTGRTGLADVRELMPGCCLTVCNTRREITQSWSPWDHVNTGTRRNDPADAEADIRRSVNLAVKALAEADQCVLLELSGGLDSSIIAACLQGVNAHVTCGTVTTPVPGADERRYAGLMADHIGVTLQSEELSFEKARFDFAPPPHLATPELMALQYTINSVLESLGDRLGVTSYMSGAGGDSVFCYLKTAAPAADAAKERGVAAGWRSIQNLATLHQCTLWKASRLTVKKLLRAPTAPRKAEYSFVIPAKIASSLEYHPWFAAPPDVLPGDRERVFDLTYTHAFRDDAPRGAKRRMRMPLLSQPVLEACLRAPTWMWFADGRNRSLARSAFADVLPQSILDRASKGSFMNYSAAIYRRNMDSMRTFLLKGHLESRGYLDTDALGQFFDSELLPRDQTFMRVLDLAMIENWVRHQH